MQSKPSCQPPRMSCGWHRCKWHIPRHCLIRLIGSEGRAVSQTITRLCVKRGGLVEGKGKTTTWASTAVTLSRARAYSHKSKSRNTRSQPQEQWQVYCSQPQVNGLMDSHGARISPVDPCHVLTLQRKPSAVAGRNRARQSSSKMLG